MTTSAPGETLRNGVPFCRVNSWLTGQRLVSVPFSDHCEPLVDRAEDLETLLSSLKQDADARTLRYIEIRPVGDVFPSGMARDTKETYCLHILDLHQDSDDIFRGFHKDCVQRKIRRAEREALDYEEGRSEALLQKFYRLLVVTRIRQQLPPQPVKWFRNLIECMGDKLEIRVASKNGRPIASIVTIRHRDTLVYKYGCSDKQFSNLGGTQLLFWKAILKAKNDGLSTLDLGRSNLDNHGLIEFKDRWGATRSELSYWRYPANRFHGGPETGWVRLVKQIVSVAPPGLVTMAGRMLYRHLG